jgi:hypothetical protein
MKPDSIPHASFRTFATGPRQLVVGVLVHAEHEGHVGIGRRRGDDDLLRARVQVELRLVALREEPGRLEGDVDAEILPRKVGRVALVQEPHLVAVHDDRVLARLDVHAERPEHRVVLEEVRHRLRVAQVVHRDDLDVGSARAHCAEEVPPDPAEAVDPDLDAHPPSSLTWYPSGQRVYRARILRGSSLPISMPTLVNESYFRLERVRAHPVLDSDPVRRLRSWAR